MTQEKGYSYILEKVLHDVKDRKQGVLFNCIKIMASENSDEIINHFSISSSASFYDDLQVLNDIPSFQPVLKRVDPMNIRSLSVAGLAQKSLDWLNPGFSVGLIIIAALVVVSLWNFKQRNDMGLINRGREFLGNRIGNSKNENDLQETDSIRSQNKECEADIWLVIPCNRIDLSLRKDLSNKSISYNKTVLIDESVYFLATEKAKKYDPRIPVNNDWRGFPEGGDLFVQLYIPDGGDLIGDDLKRSLSRKIADKEIITIEKIALLSDFNGLQEFNRA